MKIYSDHLTEGDVRQAFAMARAADRQDIHIEDLRTWKPRHHARGIEVHGGSLHGRRAANRGSDLRAASWDAWGYVIARLYAIDPAARIGFYDSRQHFRHTVCTYPGKGSDLAFLDVLE